MKLIQRYTVFAEEPEMVEPGHFVFQDNDTDEIIGFIYDIIDEDKIEIVLFTPTDLSDIENEIVSYYEEEHQDWPALLNEALEANPIMRPYWNELLSVNRMVH